MPAPRSGAGGAGGQPRSGARPAKPRCGFAGFRLWPREARLVDMPCKSACAFAGSLAGVVMLCLQSIPPLPPNALPALQRRQGQRADAEPHTPSRLMHTADAAQKTACGGRGLVDKATRSALPPPAPVHHFSLIRNCRALFGNIFHEAIRRLFRVHAFS
ncbi:MAG: hypothetical protein Pg6A_09660 [Termitinemataceae bacterium]|nr:MAG: hypothetical protein Pg6A_09660 [Termitinemataceae bacterium]